MLQRYSLKTALAATTALSTAFGFTTIAAAQDTDDTVFDGGVYLGELVLGESKRDVATDTAIPTTTIDATEIQDRQAGTIAELIDSVPGVNLVNGATAAGSGINIRGFGATGTFGTDQKVLIQVDGATKGSEELYRIGSQLFTDPYLYREVEVLRGTIGSFEYGSGVIGGVVRLESINASDLTKGEIGLRLRQTLEYSSNGDGFASSTTFAWQPTENAEFLANYTYRSLDVREDGDGNDINPAAGKIGDPSYLVKGRFTFGEALDQTITLSYSSTEQDSRDVPYDSFGLANFGNVDREIENTVASLRYNWNPADKSWLNLTAEVTYSDEEINSQAIDRTASPFLLVLLDADNRYETTTFRLKNEALFNTGNASHELRTGIEYIQRDRQDATAGSAPGGEKDVWAIYAVDDIKIGDAFTVSPALRYESQSIDPDAATGLGDLNLDESALMGGLALRYEFNNGFAVFGSAAYTENLPIIDDVLNPVLRSQSEKGTTYEIGVSYDGESVFRDGDNFALKLNYYNTSLRDVTSARSFTPGGSIDEIDREGLEIEASYGAASGFYFDVNSHISSGDATTEAGAVAPWRQNPADNLRLTLGKKFDTGLDLSWELEAARTETSSSGRSAGYSVHNLRATYLPQQGILKGAEFRVGLENVLDKQYTPHLSTRPATGRNLKLTVSKVF